MNEHLTTDERYFRWLYEIVADPEVREPSQSYFLLCEQLYKLPFVWKVRNDENRAHDGLELRDEYVRVEDDPVPIEWYQLECSIFEMLIALSQRAAFQTGWSPHEWFWQILENLGFAQYHDEDYHDRLNDRVEREIARVMNREYNKDGRGGFFPLKGSRRDQRRVELWYQLSAYLQEHFDY